MEPMIVEGMERMGIAMPETPPNIWSACVRAAPARISMAGRSTATAEPTSDPPARTAVMGMAEEKSGFSCPRGEESLPRAKKQIADEEKETK